MDRSFLLGFSLLIFTVVPPSHPVLWAATDAGQYGSNPSSDDTSDENNSDDPQYHGAKQVTEQEGRQKDLTKWVQDVELLTQNQKTPTAPAPSQPVQDSPRAPGYLDSMQALPGQPSFLQGQAETEADVDDEEAFEKQALDGIEDEIKAARKIAKAGNSIVHLANGGEAMYYHGLLMGFKGQVFQNGLGENTLVNTFNITYDFSTRLMIGFTKVSTDPRGNVSIQQRLNTTYTSDSSGLPDRFQRVTGYTEIDTAPGGVVTVVTRSNGQYNANGNPGFNNINYGDGMITSYDQTSYVQGDPSQVTTTYYRNGTYDTHGNPLTYTQTVVDPMGETVVTQRLNSTYQANPNYVDQFTQHNIDVNYTMPQSYLTGYDQYVADYVMVNGSPVYVNAPAEIQHYTDVTYNNQGLMTGSFMVATAPDDQTMISVTGYSVDSFDEWGNPLTWQTINTNVDGILSIATEEATTYDQLNHPTYTVLQTDSENGTESTVTQEMTYDSLGLLIDTQSQTESTQFIDEPEQVALENELVAEAGPAYPHGGVPLPLFTGGF